MSEVKSTGIKIQNARPTVAVHPNNSGSQRVVNTVAIHPKTGK